MTISIRHTYSTHVETTFYGDDGVALRCRNCGSMDELSEQICEILVNHNFAYADVCSTETGELLMIVERT